MLGLFPSGRSTEWGKSNNLTFLPEWRSGVRPVYHLLDGDLASLVLMASLRCMGHRGRIGIQVRTAVRSRQA